ncbi:MAG TPA: hypothetical protein VHC48_20715 [Puia sp.]|nr:hypothetical protein [Puia sp.]
MTRNYPILIVAVLYSLPPGTYAQSPGGVSTDLTLWMKAESALPAAGGTLTQWKDERNVNTFTRSGTPAPAVVTNAINFHPVVRFTGSTKLVGNTSIDWSECTAVAGYNGSPTSERGTVISPTTSGTAVNDASRYFFRSGVDNGGGYLFSGMGVDSIGFEYIKAPPDDSFSILTASGVGNVFDRNGLDARIGELYGGFTARATRYNARPQIGDRSTNDSKLIGDIAEIVLYGQNNAAGRNKVESYLALKYGITLGAPASPVNYVSSTGVTFWTGNAAYQNDIFGVGSDAGSGLTQTQSNSMNTGSGNGTGQSAKGNLVLTALTTLSSQQFLMIGSDQGSLSEQQITAGNGPAVAVSSWRLTRTWKVQNTGSVTGITLKFSLSGLSLKGGTTATNYFLMIDGDGNGNFANGTVTFIQANAITAGQAVFTGINLPDNAVFTIITKPQSMLPLALDWQDFTATADQNTARLQWTVTNREDFTRFDIERSIDGMAFLQTGSRTAHQGQNNYAFTESLPPGRYYYRIKAACLDGHGIYSPVTSLIITNTANVFLQLRSNPVRDGRLQLDIRPQEAKTTLIRIVDREGRQMFRQQYASSQTGALVTIDVYRYPAGLYFIQAQTGQEQKVLSFFK